MIPLRDENPASLAPTVTRALIIANVIAFFVELSSGTRVASMFAHYGLVPARVTASFSGEGSALAACLTVFSSMFLHGGWVHLIGNMWYLWIFGDNIEDRLGHAGFLVFYLAAGVAAAALHVLVGPWSTAPTVGASGAIAGVLGAYAVLYPRARVVTLVPIVFFIQIVGLPAMLVLGFWFVVQFFTGTFGLSGGGGVAWWAHIGGFVFGMLVAAFFRGNRGNRESGAWVE